MFLVDDILFAPMSGILWIFREIHKAAMEDAVNEAESITQQLRNLYMQLETGTLSEGQFDEQEKQLVDRLDRIESDRETVSDTA